MAMDVAETIWGIGIRMRERRARKGAVMTGVRISRIGRLVMMQSIKKGREDVEMRENDGNSMITRTIRVRVSGHRRIQLSRSIWGGLEVRYFMSSWIGGGVRVDLSVLSSSMRGFRQESEHACFPFHARRIDDDSFHLNHTRCRDCQMYDSRRLCEDTSSPDTLHGMLLLFLANEGV